MLSAAFAAIVHAGAGLSGSGPALPTPIPSVTLSQAQMFRLAEIAQKKGDFATALAVYAALETNPDPEIRKEARFSRAKLESSRGNLTSAAVALRRIIDDEPSAAPVRFALAQVLDKLGDQDGAWRQLRAIHAAGLPTEVARLVDRYSEALRARRPSGASLEIAMAPDSNINRATRSDTLGTVLGDFEISEDGKAKSGTGLSLHAQTYRRWSLNDKASVLVHVSGFADLYKEKRFNDIAADLAVGPELNLGENRIQLEVGATQRWFGQKPFVRSARVAATVSRPLGRRSLLRLSGQVALIDNKMNHLQDGKSFSGQVGIERALTPTMGLAASFGLERQSLRDPGYSTSGWRAAMTGWRDLGRITVTVGAEFGRLHADERLMLFPERRADHYSRFSIGASFRQLHFAGFAPLLRLSVERNHSSIAFYDYRRARTEIGITRAF